MNYHYFLLKWQKKEEKFAKKCGLPNVHVIAEYLEQ